MALLEIAAIGALGAFFGKMINDARAQAAEDKRRKSIPCSFTDGISADQFADIARREGNDIKRLTWLFVEGPIVSGKVKTQSGLSEWEFKVDFNDYGHITGKYWKYSDNSDSKIPEVLAEKISDKIQLILNSKKRYSEAGNNSYTNTDSNTEKAYDWEVVDDDAEYTGFHGKNKSDKNVDDDKINRTAFTYKPPSREQVIKYIKLIFVLSLAVILVGGGVSIWNIYQDFKNSIEIGISSEYALGQDYKTVVRTLKENGFTDIHEQPVYDLSYDEIDEENKVSRIEIKGKSKFDKDEKVPNNARVDVMYHVLKNIKLPISAKEAKKMNYEDLVSVLKKAGFVNIRVDKNTDLITGWITKDGSVESMSVDGDAKFSNDSEYRPDAKIVIVYHTFKD